jgi:ATP-dependent exoDNAse (exonuclease V) beta subunit
MSRYPKQDDPKGKKVIPSVTQIISDCTDSSAPLMQWSANQCREWIKENVGQQEIGIYPVTDEHLDEMRFNFRKVSQKALDIGSEVHNAIEMYLQRRLDGKEDLAATDPIWRKLSVEGRNAFNAFIAWEETHNLKPIALEHTVYGNGWAGTLDFYGYFNGQLYVVDWKSSKAHYPEMRYQVAAYRAAQNGNISRETVLKYGKDDGDKFAINSDDYRKHFKPIQGSGILRLDKETGLPDWKDHSKTYEQDLNIFNRMVDLYFERHPIIRKRARG